MRLFLLSLLCCCTASQAMKDQTATSHRDWQQRIRTRRLHLPPVPITPFRGGLSAVQNNSEQHDNLNNSPNHDGDGSVEASSSDNHHPSSTSSNNRKYHNAYTSTWTPEDFPDPWTNPLLCGGVATASQLHQQQPPPQLGQGMKRPLFCDPDQVLDKHTLRTVMIKLREFSQEFASREFVEGGDFFGFRDEQQQEDDSEGTNNDDDGAEEEQIDADTGVDNIDLDIDIDADTVQDSQVSQNNDIEANSTRTRMLRYTPFNPTNDIISSNKDRQLSSTNNNGHRSEMDAVEVAIALVHKINLPAILRADSYFFYSDQDDMINDAAQYFARYVHDTWNKRLVQEQTERGDNVSTNIVLIFISVHDRICYISSGTRIATILPWWRLEHVVQDMKPMLRKGQTGDALSVAIDDLETLLRAGSPTVKDRMNDFFSRFGVVLAFAFFTFLFATYGECQDRRKRVFLAERRSRMSASEREKARSLQKEFQTKCCPICLEQFGSSSINIDNQDGYADTLSPRKGSAPKNKEQQQKMKRVDSLGIPLHGNDEKPIKFLRCGHIFDETCWKMWVDSGHGNAMLCPVCRTDVGRVKKGSTRVEYADSSTPASADNDENSLFVRIIEHAHAAATPATLLRPINSLQTSYSSTLWSSAATPTVDYEERLSDSTMLYSTENSPLL